MSDLPRENLEKRARKWRGTEIELGTRRHIDLGLGPRGLEGKIT